MLVPPASLTVLHWISYPDLPVRQGRAAARLAAMAGGVASADSLFAATDRNDGKGPLAPHPGRWRRAIVQEADGARPIRRMPLSPTGVQGPWPGWSDG